MSHVLKVHLQEKARQRAEDEVRFAALREQNRRVIEDVDGGKIYSTDLVNCLPNGKVQTVNSMKYPTREIKKKLGISNRADTPKMFLSFFKKFFEKLIGR